MSKINIHWQDGTEEIDRDEYKPIDRGDFLKKVGNGLVWSVIGLNVPVNIVRPIINTIIEVNELNLPEINYFPSELEKYENEIFEESDIIENSALESDVERNYNALKSHKKYTFTLKNSFSELSRYNDYIQEAFDKTGVDKNLLYAVFAAESLGNKRAESKKGAKGPAQFMKPTALEMGLIINDIIDERYHPKSLIKGAEYLFKIDTHDNLALMLASYNAGPSYMKKIIKDNGTKWENIKWKVPKETRNYVIRILSRKKILDSGFYFEQKPLFSDIVKNSIKHELKEKETLYKLSRKYNVPVKLIKDYNPEIKDFNKVKKLYVINIPQIK